MHEERGTSGPGEIAGVDGSLIDAMLELEPEERRRQNDRMARTIEELRDAVRKRTSPR